MVELKKILHKMSPKKQILVTFAGEGTEFYFLHRKYSNFIAIQRDKADTSKNSKVFRGRPVT